MSHLKAVKLKNMNGFELANKINNSLTRLREEGKEILTKWKIDFEVKFF